MKKVLLTIQWYPPRSSANVLCDDKIIKAMVATGEYDVHCLVYKSPNSLVDEDLDQVHVHRFSKGRLFDYLIKSRQRKSQFAERLNRFILRLKQICTIPVFPFYEPIAACKFAHEAIKLHQTEKFDLVISEHNGLDTLYAGYRLKRQDPSIKFMPIFWDSLSGGFPAKYLPKEYVLKKKKAFEGKVLRVADSAIVMKPHEEFIRTLWQRSNYFDKIKFLNIPFLSDMSSRTGKETFLKKDKINFVFAGAISTRNPRYLIDLFAALNRDDINLWFITNTYTFEKYAVLLNVHSFLQQHDYIPNEELKDVLAVADCLVNIGVDNPNAISGKIFEYMSYGKPVISTYDIDDEACLPYMKVYPLGLCIDQRKSIEANKCVLEDFIEAKLGKRVSFDTVKTLFPENTPESYVRVIEEVLM